MAYCRKCGEVIDDEAVFCPKCGVQQSPMKAASPDDDGSVLWAILGYLIPIVGLILWILWMQEKPKSAKMAGMGALISVLVGAVVGVLVFMVIGFRFL